MILVVALMRGATKTARKQRVSQQIEGTRKKQVEDLHARFGGMS